MKLSNETLAILKNYASINSGIEIKAGNELKTIASGFAVLSKATIKETFPEDFCIYDLPNFLSAYSLYENAELEFDPVNIIIRAGKCKIFYRKTDKNMIVTTDKECSVNDPFISFKITQDIFNFAMKSSNVLGSPNVVFESDGDNIYVTTCNVRNSSANSNTIEITEGNGRKFKAVILTEYMKMIPGAYDVDISSKGLVSFKHASQDIQYWVAIESKDSNFGD